VTALELVERDLRAQVQKLEQEQAETSRELMKKTDEVEFLQMKINIATATHTDSIMLSRQSSGASPTSGFSQARGPPSSFVSAADPEAMAMEESFRPPPIHHQGSLASCLARSTSGAGPPAVGRFGSDQVRQVQVNVDNIDVQSVPFDMVREMSRETERDDDDAETVASTTPKSTKSREKTIEDLEDLLLMHTEFLVKDQEEEEEDSDLDLKMSEPGEAGGGTSSTSRAQRPKEDTGQVGRRTSLLSTPLRREPSGLSRDSGANSENASQFSRLSRKRSVPKSRRDASNQREGRESRSASRRSHAAAGPGEEGREINMVTRRSRNRSRTKASITADLEQPDEATTPGGQEGEGGASETR